jgi:hypothetical protein
MFFMTMTASSARGHLSMAGAAEQLWAMLIERLQ